MQNIEIHTEDEKDLDRKLNGHSILEQGVRKFTSWGLNLTVQGNQWKKEIPSDILKSIKKDLEGSYFNPVCNTVVLSYFKASPGQVSYTYHGYKL